MPDAHKNFAKSLVAVAPVPAASGVAVTVTTGEGQRFAAPPFNAVVCPAAADPTPANAEIVRATAVVGDVLTVTRAQEGSSARTVVVGDRIYAGPTARTFTDIEDEVGKLIVVRKAADEAVNNSAALQNDNDLVFAAAANGVYLVELTLLLSDATAGVADFLFGWSVPASATILWGPLQTNATWLAVTAATTPASLLDASGTFVQGSRTVAHGLLLRAIVRAAGTAGNVQFRWCQNTATVGDTKVLTDSVLLARKVA